MTVLEMHDALDLEVDKSASFQIAAFEPEDKDYWLNEAQIDLVKQKAFGTNYRGEGHDTGVKRLEDLTPLVKQSVALTLTPHAFYPNVGYTAVSNIPDYMFFVGLDTKIVGGVYDTKLLHADIINKNDIRNLIETAYNKPFIKTPFVFLQNSNINVIRDPYVSLGDTYVTYIAKPKTLVRLSPGAGETTICELPEQVHTEVVSLAAKLMLNNIESPRFQTYSMINSTKE